MQTTSDLESSNEVAPSARRIHYIDWLRVLSILMVFLFHAVHPFDYGDWQVKNVEQSEILTIILLFFSIWGMPFFFLVAGAGSRFALLRRNARQYLSERFYRLLVPFIVGSILFSPIEYYCENLNKIQRGVQTQFQSFLSVFSEFNPIYLHYPGFSPRWFGHGYHLWFLAFLFFFALISLPFFQWLKKEEGQRFISRLASLCERRGGLLSLILPGAIIYCAFRPFAPMEHDWGDFTFQLLYFILGFILFSDERFSQAVHRDWGILLGAGCAILLTLVGAYMSGMPVLEWNESPERVEFYIMQFMRSGVAVCFSLTMIAVGMRFLDFTNKWLAYWQEAVLPFFVLHQPMIIVIAFFVVQWNASILVKLPVVVLSSFIASIALYEYVVRRVRFLRLAFGMKNKLT